MEKRSAPCRIKNALTDWTGHLASLQPAYLKLNKPSIRLPSLEVPKFDEAFDYPERTSLWQEVYARTIELGCQLAHLQLSDIINLLETVSTQLAARLFTIKFCEKLPGDSKCFRQSCGNHHMQLLNLLSCGKESMAFSTSKAAAICEKWLPVLELPVPSWEIQKSEASWSSKCFLKVFNMPHQCVHVHTPEILDTNHSEKFEILIVQPELVYKDYVFSSLPVPDLKEGEETGCIAAAAVQQALSGYKHSVPLALNFLYLDWHFSHKKDCGKQPCFVLERKMLEVDKYKPMKYAIPCHKNADIHSALNENHVDIEMKWSLDKESPVCTPKQSCSLESRESACPLLPACQSKSSERAFGVGIKTVARSPIKDTGSSVKEASVAKRFSNNMFACNELTFFLQARHGTVNANTALEGLEQENIPEVQPLDSHNTKADYQVHGIVLSDPILKLRACLELDYLRILQNDAALACHLQQFEVLHNLHTEADATAALVWLIKEQAKNQNSPHEQQLLRGLIALYILQQTAENLCMYGIQVGHLYMESWYLNLRFLQDLVCCSYAECEEAYRKVEKGLLLDHPKLTCLGDIISKHKCKVWNPKILIISERRALFTLYKKIMSSNLKPYQFDREENLLQDNTASIHSDLLNQTVTEALHNCDCLMVPPE